MDPPADQQPAMLRPHLHLLVPSSDPAISLEARLYLPAELAKLADLPLTTSPDSSPSPLDALPPPARDALAAAGVTRLITAAHPWARLGGNMLFPVLAQHVAAAALAVPHTACLAFNARGVGRSGGSRPWFGTGSDPADFAAAEAAGRALLGGAQVAQTLRLGYSYGSIIASLAPGPPAPLMLISPPLMFFRIMSLFTQSFASAVRPHVRAPAANAPAPAAESVWVVYGTEDDFTSRASYESAAAALEAGVRWVVVDGAEHFYKRPEDGRVLEAAVTEWIEGAARLTDA